MTPLLAAFPAGPQARAARFPPFVEFPSPGPADLPPRYAARLRRPCSSGRLPQFCFTLDLRLMFVFFGHAWESGRVVCGTRRELIRPDPPSQTSRLKPLNPGLPARALGRTWDHGSPRPLRRIPYRNALVTTPHPPASRNRTGRDARPAPGHTARAVIRTSHYRPHRSRLRRCRPDAAGSPGVEAPDRSQYLGPE